MATDNIYLGNGMLKSFPGKDMLSISLDLTRLGEAVRGEAAEFVTEWVDKSGKVHKQLKLEVWPLKPEFVTKYRTHSVKVDMFVPRAGGSEDKTPL